MALLVDVRQWFRSLPSVTKDFIACLIALRVLTLTGLVKYETLANVPSRILSDFEVWRVVTPFLSHGPILGANISPFAVIFSLLADIVFLVVILPDVELDMFPSSLDFFAFVSLSAALQWCVSLLAPTPWLASGLVMVLLFYWSRRDPEYTLRVLVWRVPARALPYLYVLTRLLLGTFPLQHVVGAVVASAYINLQDSAALPTLHSRPIVPDQDARQ